MLFHESARLAASRAGRFLQEIDGFPGFLRSRYGLACQLLHRLPLMGDSLNFDPQFAGSLKKLRLKWAIAGSDANLTTIELNCYNSMNRGPNCSPLAAAIAKGGAPSHSSVTAVTHLERSNEYSKKESW